MESRYIPVLVGYRNDHWYVGNCSTDYYRRTHASKLLIVTLNKTRYKGKADTITVSICGLASTWPRTAYFHDMMVFDIAKKKFYMPLSTNF